MTCQLHYRMFIFNLMTGVFGQAPWADWGPEPNIQHTPWQQLLEAKVAAVHQNHDFERTDHTSRVFVGVADKEQTGPMIKYLCWPHQWVNIGETTDGRPCATRQEVVDAMCNQCAALGKLNPLAFVLDLDVIPAAARASVVDLVREMTTGRVLSHFGFRYNVDVPVKFIPPPVIILLTAQIKPEDKFDDFTLV